MRQARKRIPDSAEKTVRVAGSRHAVIGISRPLGSARKFFNLRKVEVLAPVSAGLRAVEVAVMAPGAFALGSRMCWVRAPAANTAWMQGEAGDAQHTPHPRR